MNFIEKNIDISEGKEVQIIDYTGEIYHGYVVGVYDEGDGLLVLQLLTDISEEVEIPVTYNIDTGTILDAEIYSG